MDNKRNPAELLQSIIHDIKELLNGFGCNDFDGEKIGEEMTPALSSYTQYYWRVGQLNQTIYYSSTPEGTFSPTRSTEFEYTHLYTADGFSLIRTDPNWTDGVEYRIFLEARRVVGQETTIQLQNQDQ
ncbi:hypothetical protein [Paenibacillus taichungensis]